jgi:type II secretory pathway component PulF
MATYIYQGVNAANKTVRGTMEADSEQQLRQFLQEDEITPTKVTKAWWKSAMFQKSKPPEKHLLIFTRLMSSLLNANVGTAPALEILYRQLPPGTLKNTTQTIAIQVRSGVPFSAALREHPKVFSPVFAEIVHAGEEAGTLPDMIKRLGITMERTYKVKSKIKVAMIYPTILLGAIILVSIAMLYFVIPEFASIFASAGRELPFATRVLLGASNVVRDYGSVLLVGGIAAIVGTPRLLKRPNVKIIVDRATLKIPAIGKLALHGSMANIAFFFSMLLRANVPEVESLRLAATTTTNMHIRTRLNEAVEEVAAGSRVTNSLERTNVVPPIALTMISVGENSGDLEDQLEIAAKYYEEEVMEDVEKVMKLMEPIMITIVFGAVAMLLLAVYTPLFQSANFMME